MPSNAQAVDDLPSGPPQLVGRHQELAIIDQLLIDARGERAGSVLVEGPPGAGKSTLLAASRLLADDFSVLSAVASETETNVAFAGLHSLCRQHLSAIDRLAVLARDALRGALALGPPTPADRFGVGVALISFFEALAEVRPLFIVVDDWQWLDVASADAIAFAARRLDGERAALLVGARPGALARFPGLRVVAIDGLDSADAASMLQTRFGIVKAAGLSVAAGCAGNPLAMIECAALLTGPQRLGLEPLPDPLPIGTATNAAFQVAIGSLAEATGFALLLAAISPGLGLERLTAACGSEGHDTPDWAALERARLGRIEGDHLTFAHPLVRSATVDGASPESLRHAHSVLASHAEGHARLWHRAQSLSGADAAVAAELVELAQQNLQRGAPSLALRYADRAAHLAPDGPAAAAAQLVAGQAAAFAGRDPRPFLDPLVNSVDPDIAATGARTQAVVLDAATSVWSGQVDRAAALVQRELPGLIAGGHRTPAAVLCAFGAFARWSTLELDVATELADQAWSLTEGRIEAEQPFGLLPAVAYSIMGASIRTPSAAIADLDPLDECVRIAGAVPNAELSTPLCLALLLRGRTAESLRLAQQSFVMASSQGAVVAASWIAIAQGMALHRLGRLNRAKHWLTQGLELAEAVGLLSAVGQAGAELSLLATTQGDFELAERHEAATRELAELLPLSPSMVLVDSSRALRLVFQGNLEEAAAILGSAPVLPPALVNYFPGTFELIDVLTRLGRFADASTHLDRLGSQGGGRATARLAVLRSDHTLFETALVELAHEDRAIDLARAKAAFAATLVDRDRNRSDRLAAEARATFQAEGCRPWLALTAPSTHAAAALGTSTRTPSALASSQQLTPQEERIASAIADGLSNQEIATMLFVSTKTVEAHLTRVYRKVGIANRTQLAKSVLTNQS